MRLLNPSNSFLLSASAVGSYNASEGRTPETDFRVTGQLKPGLVRRVPGGPLRSTWRLPGTTTSTPTSSTHSSRSRTQTDYLHGRIQPRMTFIQFVRGTFAFHPSAHLPLERFAALPARLPVHQRRLSVARLLPRPRPGVVPDDVSVELTVLRSGNRRWREREVVKGDLVVWRAESAERPLRSGRPGGAITGAGGGVFDDCRQGLLRDARVPAGGGGEMVGAAHQRRRRPLPAALGHDVDADVDID